MPDDVELLRQYCREGSEPAFRELVARYVGFVYGTALRRADNDTHRAEDVVQVVFISLAKEAPELLGHRSLSAWLFTASRNAAINAGIAEQRRRAREARAAEALNQVEDESVDWSALGPVLEVAMDDLRPRDRELVLLRYFEGQSIADLSGRLGIRENAARMRIERALDRLQLALRRRGIVSTGSGLVAALSGFGKTTAPDWLAPAASTAALSAAPAGLAVTGVAGWLAFMTKTKAVIAGTALVLASFLAYEWSTLRTATQLTAERDAAMRDLAQMTKRIDSLRRQRDSLQSDIGRIESAKADVGVQPATGGLVSPTRPFLSDPAYRAVFSTTQRARRHIQFQEFYRLFALDAQVQQKFEDLMANQDLASLDVLLARDLKMDERPINERSSAIWNAGMLELLGPERKAQLDVFQRSMALREFINKLATPMYPLGDPVTPEQTARLSEIALDNSSAFQSGEGTGPAKVKWEAVWEPASHILSTDQLAAFKMLVEQWMLKHDIQVALNPPK